ncbi:MAG: hypothetical protein ABR584_03655 [Candidatus Baltobacteraceae bacterium]
MTPKWLFGLGIALAVAGLACSLGANSTVALYGSFLTLAAIASTVWLTYMTRGIAPLEAYAAQKRASIASWVSVGIVACIFLAVYTLYHNASLSRFAAPILLFGLCLMLLLQLRAQGKIS